jgi:hypothetical protein
VGLLREFDDSWIQERFAPGECQLTIALSYEVVDETGGSCRVHDLSSPLILDMSKPRNLLRYRDRVDLEAATRATARWYAQHPAPDNLQDPGGAGVFDYPKEDRVLAAWRRAEEAFQSAFTPPDA